MSEIVQTQPIVFQELSSANITSVVPVYINVFNVDPWNDGWTQHSATERLESFAKYPEFFGLSISLDGVTVGFGLGWAERWVNDWQYHLYEMCIAPELQGQGCGRALLAELEKQSKAKGQVAIFLQTGANVPARKFYEACGFRDRGLIIMGKRYEG